MKLKLIAEIQVEVDFLIDEMESYGGELYGVQYEESLKNINIKLNHLKALVEAENK